MLLDENNLTRTPFKSQQALDMAHNRESTDQLETPERTLRTLSFCEPNPRHLAEWIEHLPLVNLSESSKQLYHAIIELNQLIIEPTERLALLELLRPPIIFICKALSKHYLNKSVVLPEKARKVSRLAMALDSQLAIGYKIVVMDNSKTDISFFNRKHKKASTLAIHRAITTIAHSIVRSCQLYCAAPLRAWHELHQLYLIAETNKLLDSPIADDSNQLLSKSTIAEAYARILMIACCSPNKLSQRDLSTIFDATELWSRHISIIMDAESTTFVTNLATDTPPMYRELARKKLTPFYRGVDFSKLLTLLEEYLARQEGDQEIMVKGIAIPDGISARLISYLHHAWGTLTERSFSRIACDKTIQLSLGFSGTHYFLSGGIDFDTQLQGSFSARQAFEQAANDTPTSDTWGQAFDAAKESSGNANPVNYAADNTQAIDSEVQAELPAEYALFNAQLVDTSPNGYRITWQGKAPPDIKTGELVGICEGEESQWVLGAIRWVRKASDTETHVGIQLIAANATPCGARIIGEKGKRSEYMRALFIPAMESMNQPASLVAPQVPFKTGVQVYVNQYGETTKGLLSQQVDRTGSFSHFIFQPEALTHTEHRRRS